MELQIILNVSMLVAPKVANNSTSILLMLKQASPISKLILLFLILFSVVSWAVILLKSLEYSRVKKNIRQFAQYFSNSKNFSNVALYAQKYDSSNPLSTIYKSGYKELTVQMNRGDEKNLDSIHRALTRGSKEEILKLEKYNGFLATTAAVTPFVGLLGTVWGIMSSFHNIGAQGNANLATVAPGIAEALIATAIGLFAAIPAVIFYNLLLSRLKGIISSMEDFILEFINICEKVKK